jgi:tRNA G18 (ribose-2'-O)-methylase SpoU
MVISINDPNDDRIANYRDMNRDKSADGCFIAEGRWLVERLLSSDLTTRSVLTSEQYIAELGRIVPANVPVFCLPPKLIDLVIGFKFHRGILACGERPENARLSQLIGHGVDQDRLSSTIVICPDVVDPVNLGGIIRNCSAFGVSGLLVGKNAADPFSRRAVRVSMGTAFRLPIRISGELARDLSELKTEHGFELLATVLADDAELLESARRPDRMALVFGGEGQGLSDQLLSLVDRRITLPMGRGTDSLNVTSSTAVFLYHFLLIAEKY